MMISLFLLLLNYKNCGPYDKMNGEYFKNYISRKFPKLIKLADKSPSVLWIQDGDPSQNSYAAKGAYNARVRFKFTIHTC